MQIRTGNDILANVADYGYDCANLNRGMSKRTPLPKEWSIEDRHLINALNRSVTHIPYLFVVIVYARDCVRRRTKDSGSDILY